MTGKKVSTFRERFNELLESSPKSRTAIAQEFGVAKQTISAWSTGQTSPRRPVVTSLAEYFNVNLGWLMGFDVQKEVDKKKLEYYKSFVDKPIENSKRFPLLFDDEVSLLDYYRSLTDRGKQLLIERVNELKLLHGKKDES